MDDLRRRFASLDRVRVPDLWDDVELRAAALGSVGRLTRVAAPAPIPSARSSGRSPLIYVAAAGVLAALIAGAVAVGSGLVQRQAIPSVTTPPSASPTGAAVRPWITGRQLTDVLSADFGYAWTRHDLGAGRSSMDSASRPPVEPVNIRVFSPFEGPAAVHVTASIEVAADDVHLHAGRIAEALAPDAWPWIQDAITQGLEGGDPFVSATVTASGGQVGVTVVDEPRLEDWLNVWFLPDSAGRP